MTGSAGLPPATLRGSGGGDPMRLPAILLLVILALLAAGWAFGAATRWEEIEDRPVRLAYLICDFGIVIPLGVAAAVGVLGRRAWAPPVFAVAVGALLFDIAHGVFYLIWDNYFNVPLAVAFVLLALAVAYTAWVSVVLIRRQASPPAGPAAGSPRAAPAPASGASEP